ncbi:MAG TPA: hypothetical protein VFG54_04385 [Prolixibacteraceae bacterium]|nr:hypothetical protein [Prolixibacteraceae bacterium]
MKRRNFIANTAISAIAVSAYGFISFNGEQYVGDCETTTDILGPFYRPNSPERNNLLISGDAGNPVELSGTVRHKDCVTPYPKAKVELWHCDGKGVYDNTSNEFRYRATTFTDDKGHYSFTTILPVPYDVGNGNFRPAHFHMMITAAGYQPLVTQLYFKGDKHIGDDRYASSSKASRRILDIQTADNGMKKVTYDVGMSVILKVEAPTIDKLTGFYTDVENKDNTVQFFKSDNALWRKNEAFGDRFEYAGNNTFEEANNPESIYWRLQFELMASGGVKLTENYIDDDLVKHATVYLKER